MSVRGEPSWIERVSMALSGVVPLGFGLARIAASSQWRDDLPLVRGLGLIGTAGTGGVTTLLVQLASLLPLGPRPFRAAAISALALAASGLVIHALTKRLLLTNLATPRLAPLLATIASLTVTLSPSLQQEGLQTGGPAVALLLGLSALLIRSAGPHLDVRTWLALGAVLGASFVESAPLGVAIGLALAAQSLLMQPRPQLRQLAFGAGALVLTGGFLSLPFLLRPLAPRAAYDLGRTLGSIDFVVADTVLSRARGIGSWASDIGVVPLALAGAGIAIGLVRQRLRPWAVLLLALIALDALLPLRTRGLLSADPLAPLHALAIACIACALALGFQTASTLLLATRTTMGAAAAVLLVSFDLSLAAMMGETASASASSSAARGAEAWTDQAFQHLPPRTALLLRSRAMAWRLWAARLSEGARPDVLIVPSALLGQGRIATTLLDAEPAIAGLLRDLSIDGRPSEASLTALADTRPLEVELDPSWNGLLASHLVADRLWLRFAPQPLGRSDRERAFEEARPRFESVRAAATDGDDLDPATGAILAAQLRAHAASAGVMGDKDAAILLLQQITNISRDDPFVAELSHRLAASKGGVQLEGLLR